MLRGPFLILSIGFFAVSGGTPAARAEGTAAAPTLAVQLETCRENVVQLNEQARVQQTKLVSLRAERKTLGSSGGEMARYKLANIDQELKERSKQYQHANTQAETEKKRCDALATRAESASRGKQTQAPGRP